MISVTEIKRTIFNENRFIFNSNYFININLNIQKRSNIKLFSILKSKNLKD